MRLRCVLFLSALTGVALVFQRAGGDEPGDGTEGSRTREELQYAERLQLNLRFFLPEMSRLKESGEIHAQRVLAMRDSRGAPTQLLRLLYWAVEPTPELRKELLTQWLGEEGILPNADAVVSGLGQLMKCRSGQELVERKREIREALNRLDEEKSKRSKRQKISGNSMGYAPVDELSQMKHFPCAGLSSTLANERRKIYERIPPPPLEDYYNEIDRSFCALLWAIESDVSLRGAYLRPRLEVSLIPDGLVEDQPDFWFERLSPFLEGMSESQKQIRRKEILWMRAPLLTAKQKAAQQALMERMLGQDNEAGQRVTAEQEARSTGTKTAEPPVSSGSW